MFSRTNSKRLGGRPATRNRTAAAFAYVTAAVTERQGRHVGPRQAQQEEGNKNAAAGELVPTSEQQKPERFLSGSPLAPGDCVKAPVPLLPPKTFIVRESHRSSSSRFPCSLWSTLPPVVPSGTADSVEQADDRRRPSAVVPDRI